MTPWTRGSDFSDELRLRSHSPFTWPSFQIDGPCFDFLPPKAIYWLFHPRESAAPGNINDQFIDCYPDVKSVNQIYPTTKIIECRPYLIAQYLSQKPEEAIIDFKEFGAVYIGKKLKGQSTPGNHQLILPELCKYILSPELWGEDGKWPCFDHRLRKLFSEKNVLIKESFTGLYKLDKKAQSIQSFGIQGTLTEEAFILCLPWTFSLSSLVRLEKIIQEEI